MTIHETIRGSIVVLHLNGRLTVETEQQLRQAVERLLDAGRVNLVLDLADVPYIDNCALGTMVHVFLAARRHGGDVKLLNVGSRIQHLLTVTRLATVFETVGSEGEAERRLIGNLPAQAPSASSGGLCL